MSIIPLLGQAGTGAQSEQEALPLYREVDWDFSADRPVWRSGSPVFTTGARAVMVWAWNALHVQRCARDIYSADYGLELAELLGRGCSPEVRQAEAERIVREALLINPYITAVTGVETDFEGSALRLSLRLDTVYGEVDLDDIRIKL